MGHVVEKCQLILFEDFSGEREFSPPLFICRPAQPNTPSTRLDIGKNSAKESPGTGIMQSFNHTMQLISAFMVFPPSLIRDDKQADHMKYMVNTAEERSAVSNVSVQL